MIKDILPDIVMFNGSSEPISTDTLLFKAYQLLKEKYEEKLQGIVEHNITPVIIPPITATFLSRLPDNCTDPTLVVKELLELRDELTPVRKQFRELEEKMYSSEASLKDLEKIEAAIQADAKAIQKRYNQAISDKIFVRWFVDNISFIVKALIMNKADPDELVNFIAKLIPNIGDRIGIVSPTILFDLSIKTRNIKNYRALMKKKIGLEM